MTRRAFILLAEDAAPVVPPPSEPAAGYTITAARALVTSTWNAQWTTQTPTCPWTDDNELNFAKPAPTVPPATPAAWCRFVIRHLDSVQDTLGVPGARKWMRTAIATAQIFVQLGAGCELADQLAENARQLFEGVDLAGIVFFKSDVFEIGSDGRGWHQVNVSTRFRYYQTH